MKDITLHAGAAFLLTLIVLWHTSGMVFVMPLMWLLRELAQRDKSNLLTALKTMPAWSFAKHMEWLITGFGALAALALKPILEGL
jgi:hypothetical protein